MKKFTLFLTLALAVANMPVTAMQTKMTAEEARKVANEKFDAIIKTAGERAERTTTRKALDSVTVAAQSVNNTLGEFKWTAIALTTAAAMIALGYWYAPVSAPLATSYFDTANMVCQKTAADICDAFEPVAQEAAQSFWESLRNIKFGC